MQRHVNTRTWYMAAGVMLLVVGLFGHILAAIAIGGTALAYRDHVLGFALLTVVSGALLYALSLRFWKKRNDITMLVLGVVQASLGAIVYVMRYSVHG